MLFAKQAFVRFKDVGGVEVHPRVGAAVLEAHDVAFKGDLFLFRVIAREGVMAVRRACGEQ